MELGKYDWSEKYAWVKDKFGVSWQLDIDKINSPWKILPSLLFANEKFTKIKEAVTFYNSIFKNSKIIFESPFPSTENIPDNTLLFAQFALSNNLFNAMSGGTLKHEFDFNEAISLIVNCETQDEVDYYWGKLISDGGEESMCGWLKDKFGVSWQVVPTAFMEMLKDKDKEKIARAQNEMFKMKKLDLNILQKVFEEK